HVHILLALDQAGDNLMNLGMHQRLAARYCDHGRATFFHGAEAFLRREVLLQNVGWILDLATPRARQVAAEQWLQHQHQRIPLSSGKLLPDDVRGYRPHLRNWYRHSISSSLLLVLRLHRFAVCGQGEEREITAI